jgi:hypothetical protein
MSFHRVLAVVPTVYGSFRELQFSNSLCGLNLNPDDYLFARAEGRLLGTKVLRSLC